MNEVRKAALTWLNSLGIRNPAELGVEDYHKVKSLLGNDRPAFGVFFSMLMFERQQAVAQLTTANLSNSEGAVRAAKLQGIIQCVDNVRDLIMNIADPIGEGSGSDDQVVAGVRFDGPASEHDSIG